MIIFAEPKLVHGPKSSRMEMIKRKVRPGGQGHSVTITEEQES